jgi:hypothetical protein
MNSRFRNLAALFALLALTVGTVQGLWASTCLMEMAVDTTASTEAVAPSAMCTHGMSATISDRGGSYLTDGGPDAPHCPAMPMGVAGSCGAVMALPAGSSLSLEPSALEALLPRFPNEARDLLLAAAFFRPPIA